MKTMNIRAQAGDKVRYSNPNNGLASDQTKCQEHLKLGEIYTVEVCKPTTSESVVFLLEAPGIAFNTVSFEDAQ